MSAADALAALKAKIATARGNLLIVSLQNNEKIMTSLKFGIFLSCLLRCYRTIIVTLLAIILRGPHQREKGRVHFDLCA
jgi:Na+-translocating ferredoxin:NAD+ oxidoreductase RnfD subunit